MTPNRSAALTTKLVGGSGDDETPVSDIWLHGSPTGKRVPGAVLEAAVELDRHYMLFMTDDVPFEETLGIFLLDDRLNVVDSARLGGLYSTGSFSALELCEPNTVRFRFIGDTTWSVRVLSRPELRVPVLPDAPGVIRPFGFYRHFIVSGRPQPQRR